MPKISAAQRKEMVAGLRKHHKARRAALAMAKEGDDESAPNEVEDYIAVYTHGYLRGVIQGIAENAGISPSSLAQRVGALLQGNTGRKSTRAKHNVP